MSSRQVARLRLSLFLIVCVVFPWALNGSNGDAPWRWGLGQRLSERYDRLHAEKRSNAAGERCGGPCSGRIVVDGKTHPELLTPAELMDALAGGYVADDDVRASARKIWEQRYPTLKAIPDFWSRLNAEGRAFFDAWSEYRELSAELNRAPLEDRSRIQARRDDVLLSMCPLRAQALTAARRAFGEEYFDRFLYEAIAAGLFVVETSTAPGEAEWVEGGCR